MVRAAHSTAHGGGNDDDENDDDYPDHALPRPVPRDPFVDGFVLVRSRRLFFTSVAHSARAVVKGGGSVLLRCCAVGRGGGCAAIAAFL
jgi:hypothetical protein